jgi:hypothetical protein
MRFWKELETNMRHAPHWRHDRTTILGIFLVLLLMLLLTLLAPSARAAGPVVFESTDSGKDIRITLLESACHNKTILEYGRSAFPQLLSKLLAGTILWTDGKTYELCYVIQGGIVYAIDEELAPIQPVPHEAFGEPQKKPGSDT